MSEANTSSETKRYAVVTGANKGIGLEICKQLASHGITVILTARDEKRGLEALEKLKGYSGLSDDHVIFHQLDVADSASVAALAEFLNNKFGKLDILVNNAGIAGIVVDEDAFTAFVANNGGVSFYGRTLYFSITNFKTEGIKWDEMVTETYELTEQCQQTNYYGAKRMIEALIPLLQLSDSPMIVNVSSSIGRLKNLPNEWAKGILNDAKNLTEERVDEVLNKYLQDFKEGLVQAENWPSFISAYIVSKAAMNAYTRILAKNYPTFCINAVCPGYVKTDLNFNTGKLTVEEGAESAVKLALLPNGGPSGLFFSRGDVSSFE